MSNRDFNLMLVIKSPNAAVNDPNEKRYTEFMAETRKMLALDKEKKLVEGYDTLRTFFGEQAFDEGEVGFSVLDAVAALAPRVVLRAL